MSRDRDDDRWENDYDAPIDATTLRLARQKVSLPAKFMIASGVFMLLLLFAQIALTVSGYDATLKILEWSEQQQPPGPGREKAKQQVEEARVRDRNPEYIQAGIFGVVSFTLNLLVVVGGFRMQSFSGRTLAIVGAVCAIIPINSCCCIGIPVGIWALIVLMNPDVKAVFDAAKQLDRR